MTKILHRSTGLLLVLFVVSHLAVHVTAVAGIAAHHEALSFVQGVYRNPFVEPVLLGAFVLQIGLGLRLAFLNWSTSKVDPWARMQLLSGLYLAFFVFIHSSAALLARSSYGLETNFYWPAGTLHHPAAKWFFYPYYALAVIAAFTHAGSALRYRFASKAWGPLAIGCGAIAATLILLSFGGWLFAVELPQDYQAYIQGQFG
jgi:succinate dehydrogenase/fumarate reductase cytochrome b subunit